MPILHSESRKDILECKFIAGLIFQVNIKHYYNTFSHCKSMLFYHLGEIYYG